MAQEADRLGYAVAWVAEAYGSDAPTVLAWIGAQTERIGLGAAVMQIPARTPAMTAMTAATLDTLSGGRFRLGLGCRGPQVSEGWHGVRVRRAAGAHPRVRRHRADGAAPRDRSPTQGKHFTLPLPDGPGKALKLTIHPPRPDLPIYLAAVGPEEPRAGRGDRRRLAGDLLQPGALRRPARSRSAPARRRAGRGTADDPLAGFDIVPSVPVVIDDDVEAAARGRAPGTPRSTSAAWARGSRTSTTSWPAGWGSRRPRRGSRTSTSTGGTATPRRPCRSSSSTRPR